MTTMLYLEPEVRTQYSQHVVIRHSRTWGTLDHYFGYVSRATEHIDNREM